jgi:hypothetical protein
MSGEGKVDGRTVITGLGCLAVPILASEHADPDDLRVLFSEIYEPEEAVAS